MENIILVDENDMEIGYGEKQQVHIDGKLHRAFSIYIFNSKNELLLQKRDSSKYHSPSLWTNTCCSHPRVKEDMNHAIHRRLKEEMGFDCELSKVTEFIYKIKFDNELTEHEYLHIYKGDFDGLPIPNTKEVEDYKWMSIEDIKYDIKKNSDNYTYWFKYTMEKLYK